MAPSKKYFIGSIIVGLTPVVGIVSLFFGMFLKHDSCLLSLPNAHLESYRYFVSIMGILSPFLYLYIISVFFDVYKHPEKENKTTKLVFWFVLIMRIIAIFPYAVYSNGFVFILIITPLLGFILLAISNFKGKYMLYIVLFAVVTLGGLFISEKLLGCENTTSFETFSMSASDIKECKYISDPQFKASCYMTVARNSKDISICDSLSDTSGLYGNKYETMKESCYDGVAASTRDTSLCIDRNIQYKNSCIHEVAVMAGDKRFCEQILDAQQKSSCIGVVDYNISTGFYKNSN